MLQPLIHRGGLGVALVALVTLLPGSLVAQRGAPTNVTVVSNGTGALVSWTSVPRQEVTYRVLRGVDARAAGADLTRPIAEAFLADPKLDPGVTYFYQVIAVYSSGTELAAAPVAFTVPAASPPPVAMMTRAGAVINAPPMTVAQPAPTIPTAPSAPLGRGTAVLKGSLTGPAPGGVVITGTPSTAKLNWQPAPGATGYSVDRWKPDAPNCCRNTVTGLTTPSWDDANFPLSGTYVYQITALYPNTGPGSVVVNFVRPDPVNPTGVTATQTGEGTVTLNWNAVPGVSFYHLWGDGTSGLVTANNPANNNGVNVTGTSKVLTGLTVGPKNWMIGSYYTPGPVSTVATAFSKTSFTVVSACNLPHTQPAAAPTNLELLPHGEGGGAIQWEAVPGAVAYTVDRAIDGTNAWTTLGSSCSGATASLKFASYVNNGPVQPNHVGFLDITGTTPSARYVYRVNAFDPSGNVGSSSIKWTAPNPGSPFMLTSVGPSGPHYPRIVGSTVTFEVAFQGGMPDDNLSPSDRASIDVYSFRGSRPPDLVGVTSSYGWVRPPVPFHFDAPPYGGSDPNDPSLPTRSGSNEVTITSVPVGPQTFTVTYYWTLLWDGTLPRVVATRSVSSQITVKP